MRFSRNKLSHAAAMPAMVEPTARTSSIREGSGLLRWGTFLLASSLVAGCTIESAPPGADFYAYNDTLPSVPGKMLRSQPLPAQQGLASAAQQWRILYSSTDARTEGGQLATSGAVFYPPGTPPVGGWPVIAWAHGTTGIGDSCAPSLNARSERDAAYLNAWLKEGFVIVATDYQGLGASGPHLYLNVRAQAYAVLDSVRAVLGGMKDVSNRVILVGQSQGGGAVFGTAGYAPDYAPELKVLGSVATGTPGQVATGAPGRPSPYRPDQVNPTLSYQMYLVHTARLYDPSFKATEVFSERALPAYAKAKSLCVAPLWKEAEEAGLTNANALVPGGLAKAAQILEKSRQYPTVKLTQPLFMGTGEKDMDVPADQQAGLARDACKAGTLVAQHVYPGRDHNGTVNASLVDSIPFVRKLVAGQPVASTCGAG